MSVDCAIVWENGTKEWVVVSPQQNATGAWVELARNHGLLYNGIFPIFMYPEDLEPRLHNFIQFRDAAIAVDNGYADRLVRLVNALEKLRGTTGWYAIIG